MQGRGSKHADGAGSQPRAMSPLMQGRGSKHPMLRDTPCPHIVAPHAGAWIETIWGRSALRSVSGRPSCRGVDRNDALVSFVYNCGVAPHAGAWIETNNGDRNSSAYQVAPHAGAWIETEHYGGYTLQQWSPLMQGRGSKPSPAIGRLADTASPLMQGRGSQRRHGNAGTLRKPVAPHAGAWIETSSVSRATMRCASPLMQGRGSKHHWLEARWLPVSRPSCRGVDRNS